MLFALRLRIVAQEPAETTTAAAVLAGTSDLLK
jgi:hypothetical protein